MTGKERVEAVLNGEVPDQVPFAPNIGQWFNYRKYTGTLPPELTDCQDELDAMIKLQCDIFSRRLGPFFKVETSGVEAHRYYEPIGDDGSPVAQGRRETSTPQTLTFAHEETHPPDVSVVTEIITPDGTLRNRARFIEESHTTFQEEHFVKDFKCDYPALRYIMEHTKSTFDDDAYGKARARVGEHGVAFVPMAQSPIKLLHNWAGQTDASLFLLDHEKQCHELFELHTRNVLDMASQAARSQASCFILADNLDSVFFSPSLFRRFELRFRQQVAEVLHDAGKLLFSHACGRLAALRDLIAEANVDGLEGIPHPPLGDLTLPQAKEIHPGFIVNGGMTAYEQEISRNAESKIRDYVRSLFEGMRPFDRFIFSSGCNTSIKTPWENLLAFRDACWEFGASGT